MLPVERMRRFVTPVDINGTGSVRQWSASGGAGPNLGADNFGRVQFSSYFRPAGSAGAINFSQTGVYGQIGYGSWSNGVLTPWANPSPYQPDVSNNQLHGYEWYKMPNANQIIGTTTAPPTYNFSTEGGMPVPAANPPQQFPTYNSTTNSSQRLDGVNEADEMNLYTRNPLYDSPYGPSDLEWLYRQQDVDGADMTSRLSQLAPISFTNGIDGQRRRRLYSLESWETNKFAWTSDNPAAPLFPAGAFGNNSKFAVAQNAGAASSSANLNAGNTGFVALPSLAHGDKKINLNYPLPVSNDPNEPVRQKWISDTYQLLKMVLPPTAIDTAEERAQLSQFVINIIDFRDPDATMTHWTNPEVYITPGTSLTYNSQTVYTNPVLTLGAGAGTGSVLLDQYGVEYNPVAINEVLAYTYHSRQPMSGASDTPTHRFFIELVNTLTAAYNPTFDYGSPGPPPCPALRRTTTTATARPTPAATNRRRPPRRRPTGRSPSRPARSTSAGSPTTCRTWAWPTLTAPAAGTWSSRPTTR